MKYLVLAVFMMLFAFPARAETYVEPSWANLMHTMARLNAFDVDDDVLIDDYAIITECQLYQNFYTDDFKWNQVRAALRENIQKHGNEFPLSYAYRGEVQLDRYDFKEKLFRFTDGSVIRNINAVPMLQADAVDCGKAHIKNMPKSFRAMLATPFTILGLSIDADAAQKLLNDMKAAGNNSRNMFVRFNITVTFAEQLRRNFMQNPPAYSQDNRPASDPFKMDAHLDSADFYSDEDMTHKVWTYKP